MNPRREGTTSGLPSLPAARYSAGGGGGRVLRVAAVQYRAVPGDREANLVALEALVLRAGAQGASLAVLPELCTTGLVLGSPEEAAALAEPLGGATTERLGRIARRTGVHLAAGFPTRGAGGALHNTQVLLGPQGDLLGHYHKNHLYGPDFAWAQPGRGYRVVPTALGNLGLCVCFDVNFADAWEALRAQGAEVVALSTAWVDEAPPWPHWLGPVGRYRVPLVAGNTWGEEGDIRFSGGSGVLTPAEGLVAATARTGDAVVAAALALQAHRGSTERGCRESRGHGPPA